jgi:hypothetical protein
VVVLTVKANLSKEIQKFDLHISSVWYKEEAEKEKERNGRDY